MAKEYMALVFFAVLIFVSIYLVSQIINSVQLPTSITSYENDTITFTANNTYYDFTCQATCLSDTPEPTDCGVESGGVTQVANATYLLTADTEYTYTQDEIKIYANTDGLVAGKDYEVTYSCYDYSVSGSGSTFQTTQTTWWSAIQLGAVTLITVAASLVLGALVVK